MTQIKAIETIYRGYRFRSRLEARWAVFFDGMGIEYEYEPEGFDLGSAGWYLPDFWLPTFNGGIYCEVKPVNGDFQKAQAFCRATGFPIWLCEGTPTFAVYTTLHRSTDGKVFRDCGIPNYNQARDENRMYFMPCGEFFECDKCVRGSNKGTTRVKSTLNNCYEQRYILSVYAARQARFERR